MVSDAEKINVVGLHPQTRPEISTHPNRRGGHFACGLSIPKAKLVSHHTGAVATCLRVIPNSLKSSLHTGRGGHLLSRGLSSTLHVYISPNLFVSRGREIPAKTCGKRVTAAVQQYWYTWGQPNSHTHPSAARRWNFVPLWKEPPRQDGGFFLYLTHCASIDHTPIYVPTQETNEARQIFSSQKETSRQN